METNAQIQNNTLAHCKYSMNKIYLNYN